MKQFMITLLCLLAAACPPLALCAQNLQMLVDGTNSSEVALEDLKVDVKVTGSIASSTWTMIFRNSSNRLLEGELTFPLPEGITVSHYAIDINGQLRDAVPVDKARGTTVLEAVEQRRIDPGLLERVEGNAFRTRIYPLPAHGIRTVVIGYNETLRANGNKRECRLPLSFQQAIPRMSITMSSFQAGKPEGSRSISDMAFSEQGGVWRATKEFSRFTAARPIAFYFPQAKTPAVLAQKIDSNRYYCLINTAPRSGNHERRLAKDITILWDASLSGLRRDHEAELALLDGYLRRVANATVNLVVFRNTVEPLRSFTVRSGDWGLLREALEAVTYDGGTQPGLLDLTKLPGREFLLFSDGLATFGKSAITTSDQPVYCINAAQQADFPLLKSIAAKTGGKLIDLTRLRTHVAIEQLTTQPLMLLGVDSDDGIENVYPNVPVPAEDGVSVSAIMQTRSGKLTLLYGYGTVITEIRSLSFDANASATQDVDLGRIWAAQKIAALDVHYDQNKDIIEDLGKRFGLVTRNTSLIVLENLSDYLSYGVVPPAELREAYDQNIKQRGEQRRIAIQNRLKIAEDASGNLSNWWSQAVVPQSTVPKTEAIQQRQDSRPISGGNKGGQVTATRYSRPIIDPENPGGRQQRKEEEIEKAPSRNVADLAALSTQVSQGRSGDGIAASRSTGTKYIVDGVQLPPGATLEIPEKREPRDDNFINEAPPLFGIGERRRQRREAEEVMSAIAELAKTASLPDSLLIDSVFKYSNDEQYAAYLELRKARLQNPSFYFQVASRFIVSGQRELGIRILSNLAELDLENYELYKMLGYKLRELGEIEGAREAFHKVLDWRPMDLQSRRDYALALADAGMYKTAVDTLYAALTADIDPSLQAADAGLEEVLLCDINGILTQHPEAASARLPRTITRQFPSDIRVVINWNMKSTDIDLWVTDPAGEKCFYGHNVTAAGGRMSKDVTQGFGPEQFLLRNASPGTYKVEVNYYGNNQVKIAGPTTVMAEIYTGWGKPEQRRQIIALQMKPHNEGGVLIGQFGFAGRP